MSKPSARLIYWDNAASTRPFAELPALHVLPFANPSSAHAAGAEARDALDGARAAVLRALGAERGKLVFTSGGSEANRLAIMGALMHVSPPGNVVLTRLEHASIRALAAWIEALGFEVRWAPNDASGRIDPEGLGALVDKETVLVSAQAVNAELGTAQAMGAIVRAARARRRRVLVHTDAVQALGKTPLAVDDLDLDLVSTSAHKIHGPKGIGALWVRNVARLSDRFGGGGHEQGLRGGTQNVWGAVAFARALALYAERVGPARARWEEMRRALVEGLRERLGDVEVNGDGSGAGNILSLNVLGTRSEMLLHELDARGVAVSAGSACGAGRAGPSDVLRAIGFDEDRGTIRVSFGLFNEPDEVPYGLSVLEEIVPRLRRFEA